MSALVHRLKRYTGEIISKRRGMKRGVWQSRYFDFALRRAGDFCDKLDYIHQNPVAAGLAVSPEQWRWSSAAPKWKLDKIDLPMDRNARLFRGPRQ